MREVDSPAGLHRYIGFDIGGTKCAVALWDAPGGSAPRMLGRREVPTASFSGPEAVLDAICSGALQLISTCGTPDLPLTAAGISCGGPLDRSTGTVLSPPNLPGWNRVPVTSIVEAALGVPVGLENDANACALAEYRYGAGRGADGLIFLTFGTGLGAGLVLDGRLYRGASEMAGEVGHIRLAPDGPLGYNKRGSAEGFCSGAGIARLARQRAQEALDAGQAVAYCHTLADLDGVTAESVAHAARTGDPVAIEVYRESGYRLGQLLAFLVDTLNPQFVIIGSVFARARDLLWPHASTVLEAESLADAYSACTVQPPSLCGAIGDYAALAVAEAAAGRIER